jgi:hypothetical protein
MAEGNDFAMGYALGQDSNNSNNDGGFGFGGGWGGLLGLIVVASLFGWGGMGGWGGGFGGFGGGAGLQGMATRADINEGFALNNITGGITAIQQGICDSTYALNNAITSGFHGVDTGLCNLSHALSDCCCATQRAIDGVNYNMATQFANLGNTLCSNTRDIIDNQNANTRSIMDFLVQDKIATLTAENQNLKFQASQANQNNYIAATIDAATAEVLRRTGHSCPTAAFLVQPPTPVNFPTNGCGTVQWGGNGGCSCGNGCGF